jgi:hypothetical protein
MIWKQVDNVDIFWQKQKSKDMASWVNLNYFLINAFSSDCLGQDLIFMSNSLADFSI